MKKIYALIMAMVPLFLFAQITWNFGTTTGSASPTSGASVTGITSVSDISLGNNNGTTTLVTNASVSSGYTGASGSFNAGAAAKAGALAPATSTYFEFTLTPSSGYSINVSKLSFGSRSTGTGPAAYSIRTSLDGFAADITGGTGTLLTNSSWALLTNNLSIAGTSNAAVTIRIYGYNGTATATNTAVWRIDDLAVTASATSSSPSSTISVAAGTNASEPSTNGSFTINLSQATTAATTVDFAFTGTATFGIDYTVSYSTGTTTSTTTSGTLTIPIGTSSITVTIIPIDDALVEGTETIGLTLSNPTTGYALGTASTSINLLDDDIAPTVSVAAGANAGEPTTAGSFTANFSTATTASTSLNFAFAGTATFGTDYTVSYSTGTTASTTSTGTLTVPSGTSSVTVTITPIDDALVEGTETISLTLSSPTAGYTLGTATASINLTDDDVVVPVAHNVVINQIFGGGGNSGSVYKNDFIELYNNEATAVDLTGWSIQFASAGSTAMWNVGTLSGSIPAHSYYLIQESAGTGGTTSLPTPDATGTFSIGASSGKAILSNTTTQLTGPNPTGASIMDKVGFGSTASGYEGSPAAAPADNVTSVQRITDGVDNNNNATDFTVATAIPRNTTYKTTAPIVASLYPVNGATGVPYNPTPSIPTISFSKPIVKGTGSILIYQNGVLTTTIDVAASNVVISNGISVGILGIAFATPGATYAIQISAGAFTDAYGNAFTGIINNTTWAFTTAPQVAGVIGNNYDFTNCTGFISDGFSQYSVTGSQVWACTTFGYDPSDLSGAAAHPNAVQMNGFANNVDNTNEDWLISPAFDLTSTTYPLLSFYSINAFAGDQLQLKVSTNYPGTGNPNNYTWTDLNGKFPGETSTTWTLSNNINLSNYKTMGVYFAFVYTSTTDDGARWTIDNVMVTNSATPPPPTLTTNAASVQFGYAGAGSSSNSTFTVTGNDLTGDISLTASSTNFSLSADGTSFTPSITLLQAAANNVPTTVYVRFSPSQNNQTYNESVTISTAGATNSVVALKATSIDPATTLEVVNWNMEWFATPDIGDNLGPTNKALQAANARKILQNIGADVFGLVEVVNEDSLKNIVRDMPGYSYVICNYGSHSNPFDASFTEHLDSLQKEAFVYKTNMFSNITTTPLVTNGPNTVADLSNPAYNYFSSGRYPFMMKADVTLGSITKTIRFILLHAKANTAPVTTAYARRKSGADTLYATLQSQYPNDNIVMLGDFNDDLDSTITAGISPKLSSYTTFTNDKTNFAFPTLALSLAGAKSTVSYNDMIDHVILSNEMAAYYMSSSANVLSDVSSLVSKYGSTTSDHYPVFTRYAFNSTILPVKLLSFTAIKNNGSVVLNWSTAQEVNSKNFVVQRSTDGNMWTTVGTVAAAGNSNSTLNYTLTDNSPATGINYYRLQQVDLDASSTYSEIRSVMFTTRFQLSVSPNPAHDYINLYVSNATNETYHLQLTDNNGKLLKQINSNEQHLLISTSNFAKGLYYIKYVDNNEVTTKKIIIE